MKQYKRIRLGTMLVAMLLVSMVFVPAASAHVLGYSAVDDMEIRYGGSTQYTTAQSHSFSTWNALGEVNIAPDTIWTFEDLKYDDYDNASDWRSGVYTYKPIFTDTLEFNEYYLDSYSSSEKKYVALHELGHALGLAHTSEPNVMVQGEYSLTSLGSHDEESYYSLYP